MQICFYRMRAKKRFGQNFITDKTLLNELVELVRISPEDEILEIGPGKGDLSELILNNCAYYHGVELDRDLYLLLKKKFSNHEILFSNEDILKFDNDHWFISKVISKNSNLIELEIINSDKKCYFRNI